MVNSIEFNSKQRKWVKKDILCNESKFQWAGETPVFLATEWSPLGLFELFFDEDVLNLMCEHSVIYASQKGNHGFMIAPNEMKTFLGIILLSGYCVLPRRRIYWEQADDVGSASVTCAMSRNRFEEILQFLHLSANMHLATNDKLGKVRPLFELLNERFLKFNPVEQRISIDESMVPYYGHHGCKQFIRGKPIRFGYKIWCVNTSNGYLIQSIPYQGAGTTSDIKGLGMGGFVVIDLLSKLDASCHYEVYLDNLFTSLRLIDLLSYMGFAAIGTIRANRIEPLQDAKALQKTTRGTYDNRTDTANKLVMVRWHDNSIVTMVSNRYGVQPIVKAKRYSAADKNIDVPQPQLVHAYNTSMGSVDRMDQIISKYRIKVRSKKWWWALFAWLVDVAVQNAWLLYRQCPAAKNQPLDLLHFRREICLIYLQRANTERSVSSLSGHRFPLDRRVRQDIRFDGKHHYPSAHDTQIRCGQCHGKVKYKCIKCDVGLHIACFAAHYTGD